MEKRDDINFSASSQTSNSDANTGINAKQEQIHSIVFSREIGWREIISDLINTEQLDPWDINLTILTDKYIAKIQELEEADFFVSGKVLLAASFLLRIKSEMLLNKYVKSIDEILFGKKEKIIPKFEKIEFDDSHLPDLIPRSPMPRFRKVTLKELIESLSKAITTENRRIKKEIIKKNALRIVGLSFPSGKISIKDRIKILFSKIVGYFEENKGEKRIHYDNIIGKEKEEKILSFWPLLHLEQHKKIWLEQKEHFGEIHIWERKKFWEHNGDPFKDLLVEELSKFEENAKTEEKTESEN